MILTTTLARRVITATLVAALTAVAGAPSPAPAAEAPSSSPAAPLAWQRLGDPAFAVERGGGYGDITATDTGFLAGGWDVDDTGVPHPVAWTSPDAGTWTAVELPPPNLGGQIAGVAAAGDVALLVGATGLDADGGFVPLVYRLSGGTAERVNDSDFPVDSRFAHVVADPGGGFLLLGARGRQTLAFQSADGREWVPETGLAGLIGGLNDPIVTDLAAGPLGRIAVVTDRRGQLDAGVAYVDTGSGFLPATLPETADVDLGLALVTDTHFWIYGALRGETDYTAASWRSADGSTWERIDPQLTIDTEAHANSNSYGSYFHGAVTTPTGFTGVVYENAAWLFVSSPDGAIWTETPIAGGGFDLDVPPTQRLASAHGIVAGVSGAISRGAPAPASWSSPRRALFQVGDIATQILDAGLPTGRRAYTDQRVAVVDDHLMIATVSESAPQDLTADPSRVSDIWSIAPDLAASTPGPIVDYEVADAYPAGDGTLAAVGSEWFLPRFLDTGDIDPVAWTAAPNQPVASAEVSTPPDVQTTRMDAVTSAAPGTLIAAGHTFPHDDGPDVSVFRPEFWSSADAGRSWQEAAVDQAARLANFYAIDACPLPGGGALAIGGYSGAIADEPAVYRTTDGNNWTLSASAASAFGSDRATLVECVTTADRVVVVGSTGGPSRAAAWQTTDGTTFTPLALPDGGEGSAWWSVHATDDGRLWMVGEARTDPTTANLDTVLVAVDPAGTASAPVALTGATFQSPSGDDDIWYVTSFAGKLALVGFYAGGIEVWTAPLPPAPPPAGPPSTPPGPTTSAAPPSTAATTAPATTATTATAGPTTIPPDTHGIVVTNPGSATEQALLRFPVTVGQRATFANWETYHSEIAISGSQQAAATQELSRSEVFVDEVTAIHADGSFEVRSTMESSDLNSASSSDAVAPNQPDRAVLEGVPLTLVFGADRQTTSIGPSPGVVLSDEQQEAIESYTVFYAPGHAMPATPVGVGAEWTAPQLFSVPGIETTVQVPHRLESIDGDTAVVRSELTVDLDTLGVDARTADAEGARGTATASNTVTLNLTNPSVYHTTTTLEYDIEIDFADGRTIAVVLSGERSTEATPDEPASPAPTAAPTSATTAPPTPSPTAPPTTAAAPTVAPTPAPNTPPATPPPTTAAPAATTAALAASIPAFVTSWNAANQLLVDQDPTRYLPLRVEETTLATGANAVGGWVDDGTVLGGRTAADGSVTDGLLLVDPDSDSVATALSTFYLAFVPDDAFDQAIDAYAAVRDDPAVSARFIPGGAHGVVIEILEGADSGDELIVVAVVAAGDQSTAIAAAAEVIQVVLDVALNS